MEDKRIKNTDGFFAAELSLDDLKNVAGGMEQYQEEFIYHYMKRAKEEGYSKEYVLSFLKKVPADEWDPMYGNQEEFIAFVNKEW